MSKRLWQCLLVAAVVIGLVPVISASAVVGSTPFVPAPLATARYGQVQPAVSWPWMVYKSEQSVVDSPTASRWEEFTDIYAYNLVTGQTKAVCTLFGEQSNPDISGTKVVYSDDTVTPSGGWDYDCDVYMTDVVTGVRSAICTAPGGQGNPSIDGNIVVWTDGRNEEPPTYGHDIYMKNLTTGVESVISTEPARESEPVINDGYVVFTDVDAYKVMLYSLASKTTTMVADSDSSDPDPCVNDGYVSYTYYKGGKWTLQLYDIAAGTSKTIFDGGVRPKHPVIGGGWVTWHDSSNNELWGYHIKSGVVRKLVANSVDAYGEDTYAGRSFVAGTDVSGRALVVWHDHRNESVPTSQTDGPSGGRWSEYDDLYGMYLTDVFGPVIKVAGVENEGEYTDDVKPVVSCDEAGVVVTSKLTRNGVSVALGTTLTAEGSYSLVCTAKDSLGNPSRVQVDFAIDKNEAPTGTMKLCGGADVVNTRTLTIDSAMGDGEDFSMSYSVDGGSWVTVRDAIADPTYEPKVTFEVADEGFHDVLVEYEDASGNVSSRWDWVYVVTNPTPATLSTPKSLSTVTHGKTFTVSGTFAPVHIGTGVVRVYKYKYVSGKWKSYGYTNVAITAAGNGYSGKVSLPSAGKWRLRAYHKDAGHSTSWSRYQKSVTAR